MIAKRGTAMWMRSATIFALACAAAGSFGAPRVATAGGSNLSPRAATEADPCFNLDLVFIIDQSGSMSLAGSANDPDKQRITAAVEMSRVLSDISLDECPGAVHRMAVVSFGTAANLDVPLTKIEADTLSEVEEKIRAADEDMGVTDPDLGFVLAAAELQGAAPEGDRPRKRVIVLLTDGEPCVTALGCTPQGSTMQPLPYIKKMQARLRQDLPFDAQLLKQDACIAGLVKKYGDRDKVPGSEANGCLTTFPIDETKAYKDSTYIFMVLLSATQRYTNSVVDVMSEIAKEHSGEMVRLEQNARDIPATLRTIVSRLAGVKVTQLQCGDFAVNPYLKKVTLAISRITADTKVTISYRDANDIKRSITGGRSLNGGFEAPASGAMYTVDGVNERYVFANPYPGVWNLYADKCDGFQAFYDPKALSTSSSGFVGNQRRLLQVEQDPYTDPDNPFKLTYTMLDEGDQPVAQAVPPRFAVEFKLTVKQPNGKNQTYPMVYLPDTKQFQTVDAVMLPEAGLYKVDYDGSTYHRAVGGSLGATSDIEAAFPDKQPLFSGSGEFEVLAVSPFKVKIDKPEQDAELAPVHRSLVDGWQWPLAITEIAVRARLVGKGGGDLPNLSEVLEDPAKATLTLFVGSGSEGVKMTRVGDTAEFEAKIEGYATLGTSTVTVVFAGTAKDEYRPKVTLEADDKCATAADPAELNIGTNRTCASVQIIRKDSWPNRASTYWIMLGFLAAIVLAWFIWTLWGRMDPVRGRLVFGVGDDVLQEYSLYTGKRSSRLKLHGSPELLLRYVRVNYQGKPVRTTMIEDGEHPPERGVRLKVANLQGQIVKIELSPGQEVRYLEQFPKKRVGYFAARAQASPPAVGDEVADYAAGDAVSQVFMRFETDAA